VEKLTRGILFQQVIQHVARLHERAAPSYVTNRMLVPNNGVARGAQGPNLLSASRACMFPGFRRNTMPIFSWSSFDSAVSNDVDTRVPGVFSSTMGQIPRRGTYLRRG